MVQWTTFVAGYVAGVATVLGLFLQAVPLKIPLPRYDHDRTNYQEPAPWPIVRAAMNVIPRFQAASSAVMPPLFSMLDDLLSFFAPGILCSLATLNVARVIEGYSNSSLAATSKRDREQNRGMPLDELGRALGIKRVDILQRLLLYVSTYGYFYVDAKNLLVYNTPKSSYLHDDDESPSRFLCFLRSMVIHADTSPVGTPFPFGKAFDPESNLDSYLISFMKDDPRSHISPVALSHDGTDAWQILEHYGKRRAFDHFMTFLSQSSPTQLDYQFDQKCDIVVDVAGGKGHFLYSILKAYPSLQRGILFDLEAQVNLARSYWESRDQGALLSRIQFVAGSFFDASTFPQVTGESKVCYILRQILHDWSDSEAIAIVSNLAAQMRPDRDLLLILEMIPNDEVDLTDRPRLASDLAMLYQFDAMERPYDAMSSLVKKGGLKPKEMFDTRSPFRWMEAVKPIVYT